MSSFRPSRAATALLVGLAIGPLLAASAVGASYVADQSRAGDRERANLEALTVAARVDTTFSAWQAQLQMLAADARLRAPYTAAPVAATKPATGAAEVTPEQKAAAAKQAAAARSAVIRGVQASLQDAAATDPGLYTQLSLIDLSGAERARVHDGKVAAAATLSANRSDLPYFDTASAIPAGMVRVNPVYISPILRQWVSSADTTIRVDGKPVAILHAEASLEVLRKRLLADPPAGTTLQVVNPANQTMIFDPATPVPGPIQGMDLATQFLPRAQPLGEATHDEQSVGSATAVNGWQVQALTTPSPRFPMRLLLTFGALLLAVTGLVLLLRRSLIGSLAAGMRRDASTVPDPGRPSHASAVNGIPWNGDPASEPFPEHAQLESAAEPPQPVTAGSHNGDDARLADEPTPEHAPPHLDPVSSALAARSADATHSSVRTARSRGATVIGDAGVTDQLPLPGMPIPTQPRHTSSGGSETADLTGSRSSVPPSDGTQDDTTPELDASTESVPATEDAGEENTSAVDATPQAQPDPEDDATPSTDQAADTSTPDDTMSDTAIDNATVDDAAIDDTEIDDTEIDAAASLSAASDTTVTDDDSTGDDVTVDDVTVDEVMVNEVTVGDMAVAHEDDEDEDTEEAPFGRNPVLAGVMERGSRIIPPRPRRKGIKRRRR